MEVMTEDNQNELVEQCAKKWGLTPEQAEELEELVDNATMMGVTQIIVRVTSLFETTEDHIREYREQYYGKDKVKS